MRLFDTHCHLDLPVFESTLASDLAQAKRQGVERFLIPSTSPESWARIEQLVSRDSDCLYYALGIHPHFIPSSPSSQLLQQLEHKLSLSHHACVAIGECGLDALIDQPAERQEALLIGQLSIAQTFQKPVILHSRKTHQRLIQIIKQMKFTQGGVLHAFSGSRQEAKQFIDLGFKLGVGGVITYPRANKTRQAITSVSMADLVLETDAPDMPLLGYQGQINRPLRLPLVLQELARLHQADPEQVASVIWQTSHRLFGLSITDERDESNK
ncbi:TatD family hydrolase [Vibrio metschnikovii]|uniref:TatD family hydrolase n=1 Tax=Vibrio metschnikovii TaxID=28172 RepID=UPI001C309C0F|nr:TatD family hydrolase [Vibrio metschnikovii]